jgi:hypothetical protein
MTNTPDALAAFDAKAAKDRARIVAEMAIAAKATVTPKRVQITSGGLATWLIYNADTLAEAIAIMQAAPIVPAYAYKGTFTRIQPEALATEKSGEITAGPFAASLDVSQGEGFGPSATLQFFVMAGDELCMARIDIGAQFRPVSHYQWGAQFIAHPRGAGQMLNGRKYINGDWRPNNTLSAMSDHRITWSSGSRTGAHNQYFWMADDETGGCDHAAAQLLTLAGEAK